MLIFANQWIGWTSDFPAASFQENLFFFHWVQGLIHEAWSIVAWSLAETHCTPTASLSQEISGDFVLFLDAQHQQFYHIATSETKRWFLSFSFPSLSWGLSPKTGFVKKVQDAALDALLCKVLCLRSWSCLILKHALGVNMDTKYGKKGSCSCSEH